MSTLPRPAKAPVVNIATRQPMETTAPSKRGGRREPLPRFSITIPNYGKYQEPVKRGRRVWVRFERSTPNDFKLCRCTLEARAVFYSLVMICDEGNIADVSWRDLGRALDAEYRTVKGAIYQLAAEGLITVSEQGESKGNSRATQGQLKGNSREFPCVSLEQSANHAGQMPPTDRQTDREIPHTPKGDALDGFGDFYQAFPPGKKNPIDAEKAWVSVKGSKHKAAIMAGLERAKAAYASEHDMTQRNAWRYFKGPGPWLRASGWLTEHETEAAGTVAAVGDGATVDWFNCFAEIAQRVRDGEAPGYSDAEIGEIAAKAIASCQPRESEFAPDYTDRIRKWCAKRGVVIANA